VDNRKEPVISRQDRALQQLQQAAIPVAVYLKNGIKLQGKIAQFDSLVIMLHSNTGVTQMIFKHAILTLQPQ
jgi:host factor-I protein